MTPCIHIVELPITKARSHLLNGALKTTLKNIGYVYIYTTYYYFDKNPFLFNPDIQGLMGSSRHLICVGR